MTPTMTVIVGGGPAPVATDAAGGTGSRPPVIGGTVVGHGAASVEEPETFLYTRATPAAEWSIAHNLNGYPVPTIILDDDPTTPVWTDVAYVDANNLVLTFPAPASGLAYL